MIVPVPQIQGQQTMVGDREHFTRTQYHPGQTYEEDCYSNSDSSIATNIQYRDWEMRVYNQMHGTGATDAEQLLAARKMQENYPYTPPDVATYPSYTANDYVMGYPAPAHHPAAASYYNEMQENLYYTPEQLAAQQYYQQQQPVVVNGELYYPGRHPSDVEDFHGGYDGSNENLSYQSAGSSGRPSPHNHYDRSSMPSSPECHKYAMYVQASGGLIPRGDNAALLCAVCGDNAACQHYGVRTCEGCKGFFKRTVQKKAKYVCLAEKKCPVDKRRRNRCQFCRYQKCLAVGMVKEVVRSDSLKGRRGRLPSKPKSPNDKPVSPPLPLITTLVRAHVEQPLEASNLDFVTDYSSEKEMLSKLMEHLSQTTSIIKCFFTRGNGAFAELLSDDKDRISQLRCFNFFLLRYAQRLKVTGDMITLPNGSVYHRSQLQGVLGEIILACAEFANHLQRAEFDLHSFACMLIMTVLNERNGVKAASKIESAESKVTDSLRDHCTYNPEAQNNPHLYSRTLSLLPVLDSHCQRLISMLQQAVKEHNITAPQQISLLFPATTNSTQPGALTIPSNQL